MTVDTCQTMTLCLLQTRLVGGFYNIHENNSLKIFCFRSRLCLMVCLSVMMLVCSPIHSPARSLSTATGTPARRASWAASTSAPHTWLLTRSEAGVTGSMRLSAPTASQPRGYKPGKRPAVLTSEVKRSQLWVVVSSDNIPHRVRCGRGQTNYSHARNRNVRKIVGEILYFSAVRIQFIG